MTQLPKNMTRLPVVLRVRHVTGRSGRRLRFKLRRPNSAVLNALAVVACVPLLSLALVVGWRLAGQGGDGQGDGIPVVPALTQSKEAPAPIEDFNTASRSYTAQGNMGIEPARFDTRQPATDLANANLRIPDAPEHTSRNAGIIISSGYSNANTGKTTTQIQGVFPIRSSSRGPGDGR